MSRYIIFWFDCTFEQVWSTPRNYFLNSRSIYLHYLYACYYFTIVWKKSGYFFFFVKPIGIFWMCILAKSEIITVFCCYKLTPFSESQRSPPSTKIIIHLSFLDIMRLQRIIVIIMSYSNNYCTKMN